MNTGDYAEAYRFLDSVITEHVTGKARFLLPLLWMREQRVYALHRIMLDDLALKSAKTVIADAKAVADYRTIVETLLTMALIYEAHGMGPQCAEALRRADALLVAHPLPVSRTRYFVRMASYQRFYGSPDSLRIYAERAFETGKQVGWERGVVDGALLLRVVYHDQADASYAFLEEAVDYVRRSPNRDLTIFMMLLLYEVRRDQKRFQEAAAIIRDVEWELDHDGGRRHVDPMTLNGIVWGQAEVAAWKGDYARAYTLSREAAEQGLILTEQHLAQGVRETEARYEIQEQEAKLQVRELELASERSEKVWFQRALYGMSAAALSLIVSLWLLRNARKKLARSAYQLNVTNGELEEAVAEQRLLRSELHHRVKNNLQIIIGLLDIQGSREQDPHTQRSLQTFAERVYSIAAVHELLYPSEGASALDVGAYVEKLCHYATDAWPVTRQPSFTLAVPPLPLNLETIIPLGIVLSELLVNTRKNFPAAGREPVIEVRLEREPAGDYLLYYRDNGPGFPDSSLQERPGGLGTYLLRRMCRQLRGKLRTYNRGGAVTEFRFPLKPDSQRREAGAPVVHPLQGIIIPRQNWTTS